MSIDHCTLDQQCVTVYMKAQHGQLRSLTAVFLLGIVYSSMSSTAASRHYVRATDSCEQQLPTAHQKCSTLAFI
jgi:hypothetical protein